MSRVSWRVSRTAPTLDARIDTAVVVARERWSVVATKVDFDPTIVATTVAGAKVSLSCEGLEVFLVPSDGRLDIGGDEINLP